MSGALCSRIEQIMPHRSNRPGQQGLDPRAGMRLEDGSAFDSAGHCFWHPDAPRGPDQSTGTALAAGLSAAGWGAFVFACPSDDPLYIAVWYTLGCTIVTMLGRAVLLRLSR